MGADVGRAWVQRSFDVQYVDDSGQWRSVSGSMSTVDAYIPGDIDTYGISRRGSN